MAKKVGSVYTEIRARLDKYERDLARAQGKTVKSANKMQGRFNKLNFDKAGKSLNKFMGILAGAAGFKAFTNIIGQSISLQAEWEQRLLRTQALIESTGGAAGYSAQELSEFARQLDLATLFDKKGILDAINVMQTFRSIQGETFRQAIRLSADLAEINQTSVRASAMQLAKILEAPDRLLSSLTRSGIIFSRSQENLIKSLVKANRLLDAQQIILKKLQDEIGGAATGAAGGLAGKIDELSYRWGEFREALTNTSQATKGIEAISSGLDFITEKLKSGEAAELGKKFFATFTPLGRGLAGFEILKDAWRDYWQFFKDLESGNLGKKTIFTGKIDEMTAHVRAYGAELKKFPKKPSDSSGSLVSAPVVDNTELQARAVIQHKELMEEKLRNYIEVSNAEIAIEKEKSEKFISYTNDYVDYTVKAYGIMERSADLTFSSAADALANFVTTGKLNFKEFTNSLIADLIRMQVRMQAMNLFKMIPGLFAGGGTFESPGNISGIGGIGTHQFHSGGHIGEPVSGVGLRSGQSYSFNANETVIPDSKLGGGASVIINNYSGQPATSEERQDVNGIRRIFVTIGNDTISRGAWDNAMRMRYGSEPRGRLA